MIFKLSKQKTIRHRIEANPLQESDLQILRARLRARNLKRKAQKAQLENIRKSTVRNAIRINEINRIVELGQIQLKNLQKHHKTSLQSTTALAASLA